MRTKDINTLKQLRQAKTELKLQMKRADEGVKDNFIFSAINKLFSGKKKKETEISPALDFGTRNAIKFLGSQNPKNVNLKKVAKIALSIAISLAAPIIANKLSNLVLDKNKLL